jgi:hypothetical protein
MKDLMNRNTKIAVALCVAVLVTGLEARADCQFVRGSIRELQITAPNDPGGRTLSNVDGVLQGAATSLITSTDQAAGGVLNATSLDAFLTVTGESITATGKVTLTPMLNQAPGEFTESATLTITGGAGKYAGATGTIALEGLAHNLFGPAAATFNVIYQGTVCGPKLKAGHEHKD